MILSMELMNGKNLDLVRYNSGIKYELIDSNLDSIECPKEYMNSLNVKKIISTLQKLDIDDTSPKEALNILSNLKELSIL